MFPNNSENIKSLSRGFDKTREEIVSSFRERIQQEKRIRVQSLELEELIDIFIVRLIKLFYE
jgi:hypothetical protein